VVNRTKISVYVFLSHDHRAIHEEERFMSGKAMRDINKELDFLKARGYEIGDSFLSPEGKIQTWIANRACAFEHVELLVALENMKSRATSFDGRALTELARLCGKAADSNEAISDVATKSRALETEWALLVQRGTPPPPSLKDRQTLDAEGVALAERMVTFLARELPNLSVLTVV
jgi:hypothetical protein